MIAKEIYNLKTKLMIEKKGVTRKNGLLQMGDIGFLCYLKYQRPSNELRGGDKPSIIPPHI